MGTLSLTKEGRIYHGEKKVSSISGAGGKTGQLLYKDEIRTLPNIIYIQINSKCVKDLNVGPETINLLEENIGKTRFDRNHSKIFYDPPPRLMTIKIKNF